VHNKGFNFEKKSAKKQFKQFFSFLYDIKTQKGLNNRLL